MTSRRGFIGALLSAAVLDPEKLLWVPGAKTISIPAGVSSPPVSVQVPPYLLGDGKLFNVGDIFTVGGMRQKFRVTAGPYVHHGRRPRVSAGTRRFEDLISEASKSVISALNGWGEVSELSQETNVFLCHKEKIVPAIALR